MIRYLLLASVFMIGCAAQLDETEGEQGELRDEVTNVEKKVRGYCEADDCGGQASHGSCWCDEECAAYGDCCSNVVDTCESTEGQACNGVGTAPCGENEFCHFEDPDPAMCGVLGAMGVCMPRPTSCPTSYEPACACNGFNYINECEANKAGSGILYNDECF